MACGDDPELEVAPDAGASPPTADGAPAPDSAPVPTGVPVLGNGAHVLSAVVQKEIAAKKDGLNSPTDLAMHPTRKDELWVTSQADDSMVLIFKAGRSDRQVGKTTAASGSHFLANPSGLAFNPKTGFLATIHEEDQKTQATTPADFMGPTLWDSKLTIFDGGHGGHMDMLHNTPNGMGIAWDKDNAYWVFDGYHSSITHYDFKTHHGPGGSFHGDGIVRRYVEGQVKRVAGVPSHMEVDRATGLLYVADTGNNRVAVFDHRGATEGGAITPNYDGSKQVKMSGGSITTFVDGNAEGMKSPSGLAIHGGILYVGDNETGRIHAFSLKDKSRLDYLDTGLAAGALRGIHLDSDGQLYFVDASAGRVVRLTVKR